MEPVPQHVSISDVAEHMGTWTSTRKFPTLRLKFLFDDNLKDKSGVSARWLEWNQRFANRRLPEERRIFRIPECICYPHHMLLKTPDGRIIRETVRKQSLEKLAAYTKMYDVDAEDAFIVGSGQHANYYHWMVEMAPKTAMITAERDLQTIITPYRLPEFAAGSLSYLSDRKPRVVPIKYPMRLKNAWFVENFAVSNTRISPLVGDFYAKVRRVTKPHRKLIISRSDAKNRRVRNEDQLLSVASRHGFESLSLSSMTVAAQATLFSEAAVVIGAHGANLTGAVFMQPGTKLIEMLPETFGAGMTSYAALAEMLDIDYALAISRAKLLSDQPPENADIKLSRPMIRAIVDAA